MSQVKTIKLKTFFLATFALCLLLLAKPKTALAACTCNYKRCFLNESFCQGKYADTFGYNGDYAFEQKDHSNPCSDTTTCFDEYSGNNIPCSSCTWGYGDGVGGNFTVSCVPSCSSVSGGSCDKMGRINYTCDPTVTGNLVFQAWQDNNEYNPNNPMSVKANDLKYANGISYRGAPSGFCSNWFTEQFTGYIWLEGKKELRLVTDDNHARAPSAGQGTDPTQCCDSSADRCGGCSARWSLAVGCGSKDRRDRCINTPGCQWTVWNKWRCSDDYQDNTGLKIGYSYDPIKDKNVPAGEITDNGNPTGLSTVIRSDWGTTLSWQGFAGEFDGKLKDFEAGWYPIQAWYTRSNAVVSGYDTTYKDVFGNVIKDPNRSYPRENDDKEYFNLQWRFPWVGYTFENVPSSAFVPCLSSCVPVAPGPATGPVAPIDGGTNVTMPVTLEWNAPASWGETCGVPNNTYTVYAKTKVGAFCAAPGIGYSSIVGIPGSGCEALPSATTNCTDSNTFFTKNTDYCWYVETNNGELSNVSGVWEFETENPLNDQEWMTTLHGDFYAGSVSMDFPDVESYQLPNPPNNPWEYPHLSYEAAGGLIRALALSSGEISIRTDHPKLGTLYFPESESSFFAKNARFSRTWPASYTGTPPAGVIELPRSGEAGGGTSSEECENIFLHKVDENSPALRTNEAYSASVSCVNAGLENLYDLGFEYRNQTSGVVVLYVTGSGPLEFKHDFTTNENYRIVFVTGPNVKVEIDKGLGSGNPTQTTGPIIEAAFVVNKETNGFVFQGVAEGSEDTDPDDSIVVEGPIIARSILLNRNRGSTNTYPSEIIKYNAKYLYDLTKQERKSDRTNYSGLFVVDVDWISEE